MREGNAILNIGFTAGAAAGPALAGLLVATAGAQISLLADAASFVVVAALLFTSRALPAAQGDEGGGWMDRLRRGLDYVRERPALRRLLVAEGIAFLFFALVLPIEVAFVKETLDAGDFGYGLLLSRLGRRHGDREPPVLVVSAALPCRFCWSAEPSPSGLPTPGRRSHRRWRSRAWRR